MKKNLQAICGMLLIACLMCFSGCELISAKKQSSTNSTETSSKEKSGEKSNVPKLAAPKPDAINITATEVCTESEKDQDEDKANFDKKFKGKNIAVTGKVSSMSLDENVSVYLTSGGDDCRLVVCYFDIDQFENLVTLRKGKKVTLQCVGGSFSVMPTLSECALQSLE